MDIDKLEAGPELDRLVAEKVMGFTVIPECRFLQDHDSGDLLGWADYQPDEAVGLDAAEIARWRESYSIIQDGIPQKREDGSIWGYEPVREYSADIAAAWEVVRRMVELGFHMWLVSDDEVYFQKGEPGQTIFQSGCAMGEFGSSVESPICRAALKAIAR